MTELPDQSELVNSLRQEGSDAFAEFFSCVRERLRRIIQFRLDYRLAGRVSESDVLQETYFRASQRLQRYLEHPEIPFFVWLRLETNQKLTEIHRHHFTAEKRDIRREVSIKPAASSQTSLAIAANLVAQMTSASKLVERAEQIAKLEHTLNEMNEIDREVIALRHFEELSNVETAEVLNIQPDAASKRYFRALKRLREIMHSVDKS